MSGSELVKFINNLSSSGSQQSMSGNYGIGAKIATAVQNPHGVIYCSWKNGVGSMIQLFKDLKTGEYGLRKWDGAPLGSCWLPLSKKAKPAIIGRHGTVVVLKGSSEDEDTTLPRGSNNPCWISKYLNSRYFRFPKGVKVQVREFGPTGKLRRITGQKAYLDQHAESNGQVSLDKAVVHWWILKNENVVEEDFNFIDSAGHVAALYDDELYELASGRSGLSRLQQFGIAFGGRRVVLYIQPTSRANEITTNTARTMLLLNNEPLPWTKYASEFRENMPAEIKALIHSEAQASVSNDHKKDIQKRLQGLFNPVQNMAPGGNDLRVVSRTRSRSKPRKKKLKSQPTNPYVLLAMKLEPAGKTQAADYPDIHWVSLKDRTRQAGEIENRAACYCPDQNVLKINQDFPAFADLVRIVHSETGYDPSLMPVIEDVVKGWYEQALVETIVGARALRQHGISEQDLSALTSEEALTAAALSRYHLVKAAKWELGTKLGSVAQFKSSADHNALASNKGTARNKSAAA